MGCQNISSSQKRTSNTKQHPTNLTVNNDMEININDLDFTSYKSELKQTNPNDKFIEIKLPVFVHTTINDKTSRQLLSQCFHFKLNGEFQTKVIHKTNKDKSYFITGKLNNKGVLEFSITKGTDVYEYKTQIDINQFKDEGSLVVEGKIYLNNNLQKNMFFTIEFPKIVWLCTYSSEEVAHNLTIIMDLNDKVFNGISYDDKGGFALWIGLEKENDQVKLIQQYLAIEPNSQSITYAFEGKIDKLRGNKIEGYVKNNEIKNKCKFLIKQLWNYKNEKQKVK